MHMNTMASGMRRTLKGLTLAASFLALSAPEAFAQGRPLRVSAISGGLAHLSALVVDPAGISDTRLSAAPSFGLEIQHPTFSFASIYVGGTAAFATLEHGANLGVIAGQGSSAVTLILGTAGLMFESTDWFDNLHPTLRLGGGLKSYMFSTNGASSYATFTADVGVGFRGGSGPIEVLGELRFMPSTFDQGKVPLRGLTPQDQQQNDLLLTIGVTIKP